MKHTLTFLSLVMLLMTSCSRNGIPKVIQAKINQAEEGLKIYQYEYNGAIVYYFVPPCCDRFSSLLNSKGETLCLPDGGITGKGDGKCPDFNKMKKNEKQLK